MDKRQLYDAIAKRCSRRKYLPQPLPQEIIDQLSTSVERYNQANEFHIYWYFSSKQNYICLH